MACIFEDSDSQSKECLSWSFDKSKIRIKIPGDRFDTEFCAFKLQRYREKEGVEFLHLLKSSIAASSQAFRSEERAKLINTRLPSSDQVVIDQVLDDSRQPNCTPAEHSNHQSLLPDSTLVKSHNMALELPSSHSAPPELVHRPGNSTPPHLRYARDFGINPSSASTPQGGHKPGTSSLPQDQQPPRIFPNRRSPTGRPLQSQRPPVNQVGWREKSEVKLRFEGFPKTVTTYDVWSAFSGHGFIECIELFRNYQGRLEGSGIVRFKPPPALDFWNRVPYHVKLPRWPQPFTIRLSFLGWDDKTFYTGAHNAGAKYPESMEVQAESLDFGVLTAPMVMKPLYKTTAAADCPVVIKQNLKFREINITFPVRVPARPSPSFKAPPNNMYIFKLQMSHTQDIRVIEVIQPDVPDLAVLVITVDTPPRFFRKHPDALSHRQGASKWTPKESWWRQTDISYDPSKLREMPTSLKKEASPINIGRWTTYRMVFDLKKSGAAEYTRLCSALHDFNIEVKACPHFLLTEKELKPVWNFIDHKSAGSEQEPPSFLAQLLDDGMIALAFEVRYQLEVCISEGFFSEYCMTKTFIEELHKLEVRSAMDLLEYVASQKKRYFDPMEIFNLSVTKPSRRNVPSYCMHIRTAIVTPTTVYFSSPTLEISNRVLRQYRELSDRFLRIRFEDERPHGKIYASQEEQQNEVFTRVKRTMTNGIVIGDRHYEFLAFGNSQFRENGAFFFAPTQYLSAAKIRKWMGDFQGIRVVAKYAARLGQCFSTTRAIHGVRPFIVETVDFETADGKYSFSDGCGMISPFLAYMAANETGALLPNSEAPSVMQYRLGGAKGVLAKWSLAKQQEIHMRPSQFKFNAACEGLEVIRWSQFAAAHLNRQFITVLSARGIPNRIFIKKLDDQLASLAEAMVNESVALNMLQKEVDPNQMTLTLASMILDGFQAAQEPFTMSLLKLWRAFSIKYLKEKAKIAIHEGAVLLGCVDETGKLKGYFKDRQPKSVTDNDSQALPEVFVQLSKGANGRPQVLKGIMAVARHPSLFAGDIQVVRGVDVPELHHLKDVVVFPRTGDRDVPSMLSGGDLDGDDFVLIWDQALVPRTWHEKPADFPAATPKQVDHEPTVDEITSFFVQYMQNDSLGGIATAHLATADESPLGVRDERCIELAKLHSRAVDYNKNGEKAIMPQHLRPSRWPHFISRKSGRRYTSRKVLGQLFDCVDLVDFAPDYEAPFHPQILNAYSLPQETLQAAKEIKIRYDQAVRRIMSQHDIETDFEVWSTFVMRHAKISSDFRFHEKIGDAATALKGTFSEECYAKAGGRDFDSIAPFTAAMYKVTQDEVTAALEQCNKMILVDGEERPMRIKSKSTMPLMSFPWLFPTVLGRIASGNADKTLPRSLRCLTRPSQTSDALSSNAQSSKAALAQEDSSTEELLETKHGVIHMGDTLALFQHSENGETHPEGAGNPAQDSEGSSAPRAPKVSILPSTEQANDATVKEVSIFRRPSDRSLPEESKEDGYRAESSDDPDDELEVVLAASQKPNPLEQLAELNE